MREALLHRVFQQTAIIGPKLVEVVQRKLLDDNEMHSAINIAIFMAQSSP